MEQPHLVQVPAVLRLLQEMSEMRMVQTMRPILLKIAKMTLAQKIIPKIADPHPHMEKITPII